MLSFFKRNLSVLAECAPKISEVNLVGRDYILPKNLTAVEIKSLLWTALDLKNLAKQRCLNIPSIKNAKVSVILDKSKAEIQLPLNLASNLLCTSVNTVIDKDWKKSNIFVNDFGHMLSLSSDIIFCQIREQELIEEIANGSKAPCVAINSCRFDLIKTLSDLMTIYEHFCRLKCLTLAWVGILDSLFITYLWILPQMKINIRYCLIDAKKCNSDIMKARKLSQIFNTEIHELACPKETINRADIISTSAHDNADFQLTMDDVEEAAVNWVFLHKLPRGELEVKKDVFMHKNSLVWKSAENLQWIYAALIVRFLSCYCHKMQEPSFDANECSPSKKK